MKLYKSILLSSLAFSGALYAAAPEAQAATPAVAAPAAAAPAAPKAEPAKTEKAAAKVEKAAAPVAKKEAKEPNLAAEIAKLRKDLEAQGKALKALDEKAAQSDAKAAMAPAAATSQGNWPAKYLNIPGTNSALNFIIRPRFDAIYDAGPSTGDLMTTNTIPLKRVDGTAAQSGNTTMHGRTSQFGFKTLTRGADGKEITSHVEMDFFGGQTSNTASAYDPRLRHAYLTYNGWTAGQTTSLWRDADTEGNVIDSQGSIGFLRQAQLRYTHNWTKSFSTALSVERPLSDTMIRTTATAVSSETTAASGFSSRSGTYGRATTPDIIANAKYEGSWGAVGVRGLYRDIKVRYSNSDAGTQIYAPSKGAYGAGLNIKLNVYGKSNIFGQVNGGKGVGRYFAEAAGQSAFVDVQTAGAEKMTLVKSRQFILGLQHYWSDAWQSNIVYSTTRSTAPAGTYDVPQSVNSTSTSPVAARFNKQLDHIHLNTIWSVTKELDVGAEYAYGARQTFGNYKGTANRVMLMARYTF